jgi:hypothetical protein
LIGEQKEVFRKLRMKIFVCSSATVTFSSTFASFYLNRLILYVASPSIYQYYRVIHKSVQHFKNSQQINYSTDHGSSYANRERNSPSFFTYFTDAQCVHLR